MKTLIANELATIAIADRLATFLPRFTIVAARLINGFVGKFYESAFRRVPESTHASPMLFSSVIEKGGEQAV